MKTCVMRVLVVVMFALGIVVSASAGGGNGAYKLEGAWVAKVDGMPGQWSYVISADPSGRHAAGHGSVDVGFNANWACFGQAAFEPSDSASPILVSIVMTGPDTASYNAIWYGLQDLGSGGPLTNRVVLIGTVKGELHFVAPGKALGTHNFEIYEPGADGDGDGFPDKNAEPACKFPMSTVDTRLPAPMVHPYDDDSDGDD